MVDEKIIMGVIIIPLVLIFMLSTYSGVDDASTDTNSEDLSIASYDVWMDLGKDYVKEGSETITASDGSALTKDTDYMMDYSSGKVYFCGGGC